MKETTKGQKTVEENNNVVNISKQTARDITMSVGARVSLPNFLPVQDISYAEAAMTKGIIDKLSMRTDEIMDIMDEPKDVRRNFTNAEIIKTTIVRLNETQITYLKDRLLQLEKDKKFHIVLVDLYRQLVLGEEVDAQIN